MNAEGQDNLDQTTMVVITSIVWIAHLHEHWEQWRIQEILIGGLKKYRYSKRSIIGCT